MFYLGMNHSLVNSVFRTSGHNFLLFAKLIVWFVWLSLFWRTLESAKIESQTHNDVIDRSHDCCVHITRARIFMLSHTLVAPITANIGRIPPTYLLPINSWCAFAFWQIFFSILSLFLHPFQVEQKSKRNRQFFEMKCLLCKKMK